jgi:hypothetical protein
MIYGENGAALTIRKRHDGIEFWPTAHTRSDA